MKRLVVPLAVAFVALSAVAACRPRTEGLDPTKIPDNVRADYEVFRNRCSKCHSLARPLTSNITDDDQWVMYVNRMRRQPGSGITLADQEQILRFLRWYAADLRSKAAAKHGVAPAESATSPATSPAPSPPPSPPAPSAPPALPKGDG